MLALPLPSDEFTYRVLPFQLHKNIGLSLLIIIVAMLVVRYSNRDPAQFLQRSLLRKLVDFDHLVIYLLISACCISGYLSSSYSGWGTSLWWLVEFPNWTEENDALNITYSEIHLWTCWLLLAVVVIHIGAAVYHGFADDGVINKMFRF